ncbi:MAG: DUF530 family protein [Candidatus Micrarchaeia archaeon]
MKIDGLENIPSVALAIRANEIFSQMEEKKYRPENIAQLEELKERMIFLGFNAPFSALLKRTYMETEEESEENFADLKKQSQYFKQIAMLKKGALKRTGIALSSHYLAESFIKMGYSDIIDYLALDGNYLENLFDSGVFGIRIYREIMDIFEQRSENIEHFIVEVFWNNEKYKVKVSSKEKIEKRINEEFGPDAKIMNITSGKKKSPIIRSKSIRISLVSAIVCYVCASEKNREMIRKKVIGLLISPIFKFYLKKSVQERKINNLYKSLLAEPEENQLRIFNLLGELEDELKNADKILTEKINLEKKLKIDSELIGAGVLRIKTGKGNEWISRYLGIENEKVELGKNYVESYLKGGRGREFLENIK